MNVHKQVYSYTYLTLAYFIVFIVTIIVLLVIFVKDDSCLKFAKLDELHEVKEKLIGCDKEKTTKENEVSGESGKNNEKPETTIITEESNIADLIKHYMTCVTEL